MATKVSKNLITNIDPSQINSGGASGQQVLTFNGSTSTWVASAAAGAVGSPTAVAAWVNFNGIHNTSNVADGTNTNRYITASYNVTSVSRNGTGDYTINFSTPFSNTQYLVSGSCSSSNGRYVSIYDGTFNSFNSSTALTVSGCRICVAGTTGSLSDTNPINVLFFRA